MSTSQAVVRITTNPRPAKEALPPAWWATQKLKAERVQDELVVRLSRRQVEERMPLLPGWQLLARGKAIESARDFSTHEVAALYGSFVNGFAGSLGIPVEITVAGAKTVVRLYSPRSQGRKGALSEGLLGFAKMLG
ncbi:MAG TPA: hypothetical protein VGX68_13790 [Thermoanaerobaculia bacterium]|nr:hypothetical protein [Thermoanaerobaculia bacterium]